MMVASCRAMRDAANQGSITFHQVVQPMKVACGEVLLKNVEGGGLQGAKRSVGELGGESRASWEYLFDRPCRVLVNIPCSRALDSRD